RVMNEPKPELTWAVNSSRSCTWRRRGPTSMAIARSIGATHPAILRPMRAVTFQAPYEVRVDEKPEPELLEPDDAIVRIEATGYHATQQVRPGDTAVVLGLGPVGLCAVQAARVAGAAQVVAIDTVSERLEMARKFGAQPVHLTEESPRDEIKRLTGGRGADVVVEAVGNPQALELAIRLASKCGVVAVIGVYAERCEVHMGLLWIKALRMETG